jgi:hypothetical protein
MHREFSTCLRVVRNQFGSSANMAFQLHFASGAKRLPYVLNDINGRNLTMSETGHQRSPDVLRRADRSRIDGPARNPQNGRTLRSSP